MAEVDITEANLKGETKVCELSEEKQTFCLLLIDKACDKVYV